MWAFRFGLLCLLAHLAAASAVVAQPRDWWLSANSSYPPRPAVCPSGSLVRAANGLSAAETKWLAGRRPVADRALAAWLGKRSAHFDASNLPTVALTSSGGGFRAFLTGAGVVQALDARDNSSCATKGLWQSLTYHSGLSGGNWLVNGIAGNDWQTVSALTQAAWAPGLNSGLFAANFSLSNPTYVRIANDLAAKMSAGYTVVADDVWGRLLSEILLEGNDAGASYSTSGLARQRPFQSFAVPFPIITSIGVDTAAGHCLPTLNATQYEFSPFEFGSWDAGVTAFAPTRYLGSNLTEGRPTFSNETKACVTHYDQLGYVLGTSSNLFNEVCKGPGDLGAGFPAVIEQILKHIGADLSNMKEYAVYPNPFRNSPVAHTSPDIAHAPYLSLVDGGETDQNDPIWPFLQPARSVDVLIVNDNSADTPQNYPNGSEIHQTYLRAQQVGLAKMPEIPNATYFTSPALAHGRPTFFGCNSPDKLTIVYLPNYNFTYDSGQSTYKLQYSTNETYSMIHNGNAVASQNGSSTWPTCLACAVMKKTGSTLPSPCKACFAKYCYN